MFIVWAALPWSAVALEPVLAQAPPAQRATAAKDLSPNATARASLNEDANTTAAHSSVDLAKEQDLSERVPGLVRASRATLQQKVARVAEELIWRTLTPWRQAKLLSQARYWFIGKTFDGCIFDDGSVELRAKHGVGLSPVLIQRYQKSSGPTGAVSLNQGAGDDQGVSRTLGPPGLGVGIGVAQPGRVFTRLMTGKEPPNAEARLFMEQTLALRERLMAAEAERSMVRSAKDMNSVLTRLWNTPGSFEHQQEETFVLWDSCADDDTGQRGRDQIEAFLQKLQSARGTCPFAPEVLTRLNEKRKSKRALVPCD